MPKKIDIDIDLMEDTTVVKCKDTYFIVYRMNREQFERWRESLEK